MASFILKMTESGWAQLRQLLSKGGASDLKVKQGSAIRRLMDRTGQAEAMGQEYTSCVKTATLQGLCGTKGQVCVWRQCGEDYGLEFKGIRQPVL